MHPVEAFGNISIGRSDLHFVIELARVRSPAGLNIEFPLVSHASLLSLMQFNLESYNIELTRAQSAIGPYSYRNSGDSSTHNLGVAFNDLLCLIPFNPHHWIGRWNAHHCIASP
jgi:hypothetical protein